MPAPVSDRSGGCAYTSSTTLIVTVGMVAVPTELIHTVLGATCMRSRYCARASVFE